jgi:CheY-like chemotaxis protein
MQEDDQGEHLLLVVEDELDDFILLREAFRRAGVKARVLRAETGAEALETLANLNHRMKRVCVVSDIRMPGLDGFALLEQLKSRPAPAPLRFAFLTSRCDQPTEQRAYANGADAFFVKPVSFSALIEVAAKLEKLLEAE